MWPKRATANEAKPLRRHYKMQEAGALAHGAIAFIGFELCRGIDFNSNSSAVTTTLVKHHLSFLKPNARVEPRPLWAVGSNPELDFFSHQIGKITDKLSEVRVLLQRLHHDREGSGEDTCHIR